MSERGELLDIPPPDIRPNDENPRIHFPETTLQMLADSIDEVGIQVPLSVYPDDQNGPTLYVLIDGERRWRCAKDLGMATVPAIVNPPPNPTDNLRRMFNIHMVREPWADMPTAWALKKIMARTEETDPDRLHEMTGLSLERIKRLQLAIELPDRYQQLIDEGEVPLNFFWELNRYVMRPLKQKRPGIFANLSEDRILKSLVDKYLSGVASNTVELRRVSQIIGVAADEAGGPEGTSDLDIEIEALIREPDRTIQETYERTVEMVIEAGKFARQCDLLVQRFDRLMLRADSDEDRALVVQSIQALVHQLDERLAGIAQPA
jgi:ParB family transcriptional regulator, chromosome partitioning protein